MAYIVQSKCNINFLESKLYSPGRQLPLKRIFYQVNSTQTFNEIKPLKKDWYSGFLQIMDSQLTTPFSK